MADNSGGSDEKAYKLVWMKMPSKWWGVGLWASVSLAVLLVVLPLLVRAATARRKLMLRPVRSVYQAIVRGMTYFLVFVFILGPFSLEVMATTDTQYEQLSDRVDAIWGEDNVTITYTYDDNGSMTQKDVSGGSDEHTVDYTYNLQNRLIKVVETRDSVPTTVAEYSYNSDGVRVQKITEGGDKVTDYLIDPANHTGYAQVLTAVTTDSSGSPDVLNRTSYTIGDNVIDETASTDIGEGGTPSLGTADYLIYDGHGSVRHRAADDEYGDLKEYVYEPADPDIEFNTEQYDAYGNSLIPLDSDTLAYAGEMWDNDAGHYYNRARWYNPQPCKN